ncbi:hypothetical protein [Microcoleus sp. PH2017_34_RAT_O_A]|nr:hypothetical protein [Microcoleus sp. PH2017_34_RAT_O_A]
MTVGCWLLAVGSWQLVGAVYLSFAFVVLSGARVFYNTRALKLAL